MKRKIILVDDKPVYRKAMRTLLNSIQPVDIIGEASNGREFLELIDATTPELIFMDIEMPEMNGIEATREAIKKYPDLIIIGVSMYENPQYIDSLIDAGARGYLLKLSDNSTIYKTILNYPIAENFFSKEIALRRDNKEDTKKTILVVDDFENTRFVVEFTLQQAGYDVFNAYDGYEAYKKLDGRKIDLIVTDYNMPRMDGVDLAKKARTIELYKQTPILVLTTEISPEKKARANELGIIGWIQKPFRIETFLALVEKALR